VEEKICARVRLYMGSPRWMNLVAGLLPGEFNARNGICEKNGYPEVVWMEIAIGNCFYMPARERCSEQLRGS